MSGTAPLDGEIERLLDEAVAEIAHRLRTPLTVIVGYAELLRMRDDETTRREAPLRIQEAAEGLLALVDETLASAESRAGEELLG
ncbi:MAG: histidine kinase dimerization/phospho-acceptor domain-containing protein [Gaiellaceae bacterium]